jgi:hypothetical protein
MSVAGSQWSVVGGWRTWCVAWWSVVRGQLLGRGHKLQVGPNTDHREPKIEKQAKPECFRKEAAYKNMSVTSSLRSVVGGCRTWPGASWWSLVCSQLFRQGNALRVGLKTDHRKPKTETRGWLVAGASFLLK